jgi:hypothetical protein
MPNERAAALALSTRSLLSTTTAEEESTDSTDAMPGGSRSGGWAGRVRGVRAGRAVALPVARPLAVADVRLAADAPLLGLIATRSP